MLTIGGQRIPPSTMGNSQNKTMTIGGGYVAKSNQSMTHKKTLPLPQANNNNKERMIEMSDDDSDDDKPVPLNLSSNNNRKRTVDSEDSEEDNANGQNGKGEAGKEEPVEELLRIKRQRFHKPFTEELLISPNGLEKIYFEFPLICKYNPKYISEADYLKKLLINYKEWAFQLHPGLSFPDLISRTEVVGVKARTKTYTNRLRDKERDRYTSEVIYPLMKKREEFNRLAEKRLAKTVTKEKERQRQLEKEKEKEKLREAEKERERQKEELREESSKLLSEFPTQIETPVPKEKEPFDEDEAEFDFEPSFDYLDVTPVGVVSNRISFEESVETTKKESSAIEVATQQDDQDIFGEDSDEENMMNTQAQELNVSETQLDETYPQEEF